MPFENRAYKDPVKWEKPGFSLPRGAFVGGHEHGGEILYIGRGGSFGASIPGKFVPSTKTFHTAHDGREDRHIFYEILVAAPDCDIGWECAHHGRLPLGAIQGGQTDKKEPLFIGRAHYNRALIVGCVDPRKGICEISAGGSAVVCREYDVLVGRAFRLV